MRPLQNVAEVSDAVGGACACGAAFVRVVAMDYIQGMGERRTMDDVLEPGFVPRLDDFPEDQLW